MEVRKASKKTSLDEIIGGEFEISGGTELFLLGESRTGSLVQQDFLLRAEYGDAQFSLTTGGNFKVEWGSYKLRSGLKWTGKIEEPIIELHCQLSGHSRSIASSLQGPININSGDHTLFYLPELEGYMELKEDSQGSVFSVRFTDTYFLGLGERYPDYFGDFAERVDRKEPFWLDRWQHRMSPAMFAIIEQIRNERDEGIGSEMLVESHILKLLAHQVQQRDTPPARHTPGTLTSTDRDKIVEARAMLLSRIDDPPSVMELARLVGTNEFKLKRGFRDLFGKSPYALLLAHKLEDARSMLRDTGLSISEISYRIGYRDPAHFTHAFRKHFGLKPSDIRKKAG